MRVRLSDPTLIEEFLAFLRCSGFVATPEAVDTVRASLPVRAGREPGDADVELFLTVWLRVALRVWKDLWPDAAATVLAPSGPARRAA